MQVKFNYNIMKYKKVLASELKKGDYVCNVNRFNEIVSIFIFEYKTDIGAYFTPIYNCNIYLKEKDGTIGFDLHRTKKVISKQTADKYIKDHEEKV